MAWGHLHLAIFKQVIHDHCATALSTPTLNEQLCAEAEFSIAEHEIGHLIGLVNNGLPMTAQHEDPEYEHHDADDQCVMYWAYDGVSVIDVIGSSILGGDNARMGFDEDCLNDIAAAREGK